MRLRKSLVFHILVFALFSSVCAADDTRFSAECSALNRRTENIIHPILHGKTQKKGGFWSFFCNTVKTALAMGFNAVRPGIADVLFHNGFFSGSPTANASLSLDRLSAAEEEIKKEYPDWSPDKQCPHGIYKCPRMGNNSKNLLKAIKSFTSNIKNYEKRVNEPYFSGQDTDRVFKFLNSLLTKIGEQNLFQAAEDKKEHIPDDRNLKSDIRIVHYLIALPTEFHDITPHWKKNRDKIDTLLDFLPIEQKRNLWDYMKKLAGRARDPKYGHRDGDSSINLLFSGPSGSGKTFVGTKLPELLGFNPIRLTFEELRRGQDYSFNELSDLDDESPLSGLETKILQLQKGEHKGIAALNMIVFVDELDEDRNYSLSELKEQFDQFKKIQFPALGLGAPGFMNCIFTTNNAHLLRTPALVSRFTQVAFPDMANDKKADILFKYLLSRLKQYKELKKEYNKKDFADIVKQVVSYDDRINIRILMDNIDSVIYFFDTQRLVKNGEDYLLPPEDRNKGPETFEHFLERTFGNLDLKESKRKAKASRSVQKTRITSSSSDEAYDSDSSASSDSEYNNTTSRVNPVIQDFELNISNPEWSDDDVLDQASSSVIHEGERYLRFPPLDSMTLKHSTDDDNLYFTAEDRAERMKNNKVLSKMLNL